MPDAIILFAHGAREREWAEPFEKIQRRVAKKMPGARVELAFLEIMQPSLPDTIAKLVANGISNIHIVPLFMAQGGHLKHDLPRLIDDIRKKNPGLTIEVSPAIGEAEEVLTLIADWVCRNFRTH